jgi:hypothetical protein
VVLLMLWLPGGLLSLPGRWQARQQLKAANLAKAASRTAGPTNKATP